MIHAYLGFGSNLGDGAAVFRETIAELAIRGVEVLRTSSLYSSEPWGGADGGVFTNAVLEVRRGGSARGLFEHVQVVEKALGRVRGKPFAARTCDLDLLLWGREIICDPDLRVPHPRMTERKFVLVPLCELIPNYRHPELHGTFAELLRVCPDPLRVWPRDPHSASSSL
ncbi:MAG: 2-amino-4-hydroxy-6-hydroxymethyldihydropteridine diphosphokinase [bacterium]|nr:2-amino-4-hydroxy-6-hydroxymethyldihydropteridine diphosphokinase [bacterium]